MTTTTRIQVGQRITNTGHFYRRGIVSRIHGEQAPESCRTIGGFIATGGRAEFDVVFDDGSMIERLPESIARSLPWRIEDDMASPEETAEWLAIATAARANKVAAKAALDSAFAAECAALPAQHPELITEVDHDASGARGSAAAANIRRALKAAGIKGCRVVSPYFGSITVTAPEGIEWRNTREASHHEHGHLRNEAAAILLGKIKDIAERHEAGSFDGMDDCYKYRRSAFCKVFGDCQYIHIQAAEGGSL